MKILLYGINYSPELTGIGKYSGEFARWCAKQGHEVRVLTAPAYYPDWRVAPEFSSYRYEKTVEDEVSVTRCPLYVPSRPSSITRILHLSSFTISSMFALFANVRWKPDLVIQVAPTLFCSPATLIFSKLVRAHSVLHIQDYEIDAMFGLSMAGGGGFRKLAYWFERTLLRRFGSISTISDGMIKRAIAKGVEEERLILFPNWSEIDHFRGAAKNDGLLRGLGMDPTRKIILYSGSMGEKQGLESVLDAAERLSTRDDIQFLLVGEGGAKSSLEDDCARRQLRNVIFAPLQSYDVLPDLLASAACHLVIQKRGAADAVLPSKLTNILAVGGNSVVTADEGTSLGNLITDWPGIGCRVVRHSAG